MSHDAFYIVLKEKQSSAPQMWAFPPWSRSRSRRVMVQIPSGPQIFFWVDVSTLKISLLYSDHFKVHFCYWKYCLDQMVFVWGGTCNKISSLFHSLHMLNLLSKECSWSHSYNRSWCTYTLWLCPTRPTISI